MGELSLEQRLVADQNKEFTVLITLKHASDTDRLREYFDERALPYAMHPDLGAAVTTLPAKYILALYNESYIDEIQETDVPYPQ